MKKLQKKIIIENMINLHKDNKCSIVSSIIKGRRIGCISKENFDYINKFYKKNNIDKNLCDKNDDLCKLEKVKGHNDDLDKIYRLFYKPKYPQIWDECKNRKNCNKKWLNNNDISNIMNHYMYYYKNFLFFGIFYIDYYYIDGKNLDGNSCPLNRLNFDELNKNNINICAMIFNTARYKNPGEHWISLLFFWKGNTGEINFFDSYGDSDKSVVPDQIIEYMKIICNTGKKYNIHFTCQMSKIKHQRKNGECGVYSIYFVIHSLNNSLDSIQNRISDEDISKYRHIYWRK